MNEGRKLSNEQQPSSTRLVHQHNDNPLVMPTTCFIRYILYLKYLSKCYWVKMADGGATLRPGSVQALRPGSVQERCALSALRLTG